MIAIETTYQGYRFRSRLEARWAVFFDVWGVKWRYEPDGFRLPSGRNYLPDFYLDQIGYIEIKPSPDADDGKCGELIEMLADVGEQGYVICDSVPSPTEVESCGCVWSSSFAGIRHAIDSSLEYWFTACPCCQQRGITFQGRSPRVRCLCLKDGRDRCWNERAVMPIRMACLAARSMRFDERG